jgi:hypothetical protein
MKRLVRRDEDLDLRGQLLRESVGMAKFALAGGKAIPASVAATIDAASAAQPQDSPQVESDPGTISSDPAENTVEGAATRPERAPPNSHDPGIRKLVAAHERLSQIVAPATPQAILLLGSHGAGSRAGFFLGPVPLVHRMMLAALLSLALFIGMALFPEVTGDISFQNAHSLELLLNLLLLLAAAGLGASFAALFTVNRFIVEANYDPKFEASYWIRFALGLIAGIILAELVPVGGVDVMTEGALLGSNDSPNGGISRLAKPMLALLGGFSSAVVYRILNRLVTAVDTLVRGEAREIVAAQEQAATARVAEQTAQSRMAVISRLIALQQQLNDGVATEKIKAKLAEVLDDFMGADLSSAGAPGDEEPEDQQAVPRTPTATNSRSKTSQIKPTTVKPADTKPVDGEEQ